MVLLVVLENTEKLDILKDAVLSNVELIETKSVTTEKLDQHDRIGFLYHQESKFPFLLDTEGEAEGTEEGYFSPSWT